MSKLAIDKAVLASIIAITLSAAGNCLLPFTQNPSSAVEISQTNEPERIPDGKMVPVRGKANVTFTNATNATISYQAVDQSQRRILAGKSTATLKDLKLPVSIVFRREDDGFLKVTLSSIEPGTVEVKLDETSDLGLDKQSLAIRNDGALFLR